MCVCVSAQQIRWFGGYSHQIFPFSHQKMLSFSLDQPPRDLNFVERWYVYSYEMMSFKLIRLSLLPDTY